MKIRKTAITALCVVCAIFALSAFASCGLFSPKEAEHEWDGGVVTVAPTCTEEGEELYTCTVCGETRTEKIPALGHVAGNSFSYDEDGHSGVCAVCGETLDSEPHTFDEGSVTTAPACEEPGERTFVCTVCGWSYTEEVAPLGHNFVAARTVAPTCTEQGYTVYECTRCGDTYEADYTDPTGHSWDEGVVTVAPTCTEEGEAVYTCTVCGAAETRTLPAAGHVLGGDYEADENGHSGVCTVCGETLDSESHTFDDGVVTTEPTCTEPGETTYTCTVCGWSYTKEIEALGHDYAATVTPPTCTEDGYTTYVCSRCGDTYVADETGALGHDYTDIVTKEATCTEDGEILHVCSRCGYSYTETVEAAGHQFVYSYVGGDVHWQVCTVCGYTTDVEPHDFNETYISEPGCETDGEILYVCSGCGYYYTEKVAALGHNYVMTNTATADCTSWGYVEYTCTRCDDVKYENLVAPLGHTYGETYYSDENGHWLVCVVCGATTETADHFMEEVVTTEPTCTADGEMTYACAVCGYGTVETILATGHTPVTDSYIVNNDNGTHSYTCANCVTWVTESCSDFDESVTTEPTCTEDGCGTYTCTLCDYSYDDAIPATGHSYDTGTVTAPTCTEDGYTTYVCSVCNDSYVSDYVPAKGHTFTDKYEGNEDGHWLVCDVCGTADTTVASHDYDDGVVTTEPSCTANGGDGEMTYTCTACGYEKTEAIPAGHTDPEGDDAYLRYFVGVTVDGVETCTWGYACTVCGTFLYALEDASGLTLTISTGNIVAESPSDYLGAALESALSYNNVTVVLGASVTMSSAFEVTGSATLGLNGYSLLLDGGLTVSGALTVSGGTMTSSSSSGDSVTALITNKGTLTIEGCTITSDSSYLTTLISNGDAGTLTIEDCVLSYSGDSLSALVTNGGSGSTLTVTGTSFVSTTGGAAAVAVTSGTADIVSAYMRTYTGLMVDGGEATLEGATFGGTYDVYVTDGILNLSNDGTNVYLDSDAEGTIYLTFEGNITVYIELISPTGSTSGNATLGQTLYVGEGQDVTVNLGKYNVITLGEGYDYSEDLVAENHGTLTIVGDSFNTSRHQIRTERDSDYLIANYAGATLDMEDVFMRTYAAGQTLIYNESGATLIVSGGIYYTLDGQAILNYGTADIEGATIKSTRYSEGTGAIANHGEMTITDSVVGSSDVKYQAIIVNGSEDNTGAALTIEGGTYTANEGHIVLNYGSLTITDATLSDSNYSDKTYARVSEDESHALIESHSGDVTLTDVEMYAYECGIELCGGILEVDGGLLATTYCDSTTSTDGDHFFYIVYVPDGGDAGMTLSGNVTIKDGIGVAYGGTLDLTIDGEVKFDAYYNTENGAKYPIAQSRSAVENFGTMKISGTGTLRMVNYEEENEENWENKSVDFTSTGNDYYFVRNFGTMTISGVTISSPYTESALITNGWQTASSFESDIHAGKTGSPAGTTEEGEDPVYATMTIDGGSFSGGKHVVKNDYAGKLVINGGTFDAVESVLIGESYTVANSVICSQDILEITGGTFNSNGISDYVIYIREDAYEETYEKGQATITDGAFNGGTTATLYVREGDVTVTGGTFAAAGQYAIYVNVGAALTFSDAAAVSGSEYGIYNAGGDLELIGSISGASLTVYAAGGSIASSADADIFLASGVLFDAIWFYGGTANVCLIGNVTLGTGLLIGEDASVTLDLGTFALTLVKAYTDDDAVITNYGTAVVYGGRGSSQLGISGGTASDNMIRNYGEMTLKGVYLETGTSGRTLIVNGSDGYTGATLRISGGTYKAVTTVVENRGILTAENADLSTEGSEGYAIVSDGDVSMTGGTLKASADGIYITAGTLTLDGGESVEVEGDDDDDEVIIMESALTIEAGDGCCAIYVAGTVEIVIENSVSVAGTIYVAEDAELTLTVDGILTETAAASLLVNAGAAGISGEGEITLAKSGVDYLIQNLGDMTISSVTVSSPWGANPMRLIENGWESEEVYAEYFPEPDDDDPEPTRYTDDDGYEYATLTIESGTFTGGWYVINNDYRGILEIEDGSFCSAVTEGSNSATNVVVGNRGEAEISGGYFDGTYAMYTVYAYGDYKSDVSDSVLTITGGTFTGGTSATLYASSRGIAYISGDTYFGETEGASIYANWSAVVTVEDGTFEGKTATKTENNGKIIINGGTFTAGFTVTSGDYYITTSDTVYISTSGSDVINLYIETEEANVVLTGNATLGCTLYVAEGQTLNLDLGTSTLTLSAGETDDTAVIENHGILYVYGGYDTSWEEGSSQIANEDTEETDALIENYGEATLKGVYIADSSRDHSTDNVSRTLIVNGSAEDYENAFLTIEGSYLEGYEDHIIENYGTLAMENTTLKDGNYTDNSNKQTDEDESHALMDIYAGDVTLTDVTMYAYECGIEMFGGSLTISGGTYATPYDMSTNTGAYYYIVYVTEGENTITINDEVTFKDGICVAYGAALDLTVDGTLSLDVYYPKYSSSSRFPDGRYLIENYGTMEISGTGIIEQCDYSEKYSDTTTYPDITDDLAGLKASDVTYLICNYGTMTMDGVTVSTPYTLSALIHNGWSDESSEEDDSHAGSNADKDLVDDEGNLVYATLTIEGGTFTGGKHVVKNDYDGYLVINGGTFTALDGASSVICNQDILEINGGSFDGSAMTLLLDYENDKFTGLVIYDRDDAYDATYEMGVTTISGGEFVAGENICVYVTAGSATTVSDGTFSFTGDYGVYLNDGDLTIEDGTFNGGTYPVYAVNGTLTISDGVEAYVCATGSDRINLNLSGDGEMTVTLEGNTILGSQIYVGEGQTLNLNLSGYTLSCYNKSETAVIVNYGILCLAGASASTSNQLVTNATSPEYGIENHGTATLTELRFSTTAEYTALMFNDEEATLSICSGYYRSLSSDYVIENLGTLTIENATLIAREGGTVEAVIKNSGNLEITGGTYTADEGHIIENYGILAIENTTLKDSNYTDVNIQKGEDESHALIDIYDGDVTLKNVTMYAFECGIEMFGGSLTIKGGTYATPYEMSTNAGQGLDYFYYIVYVSEGENTITINDEVTFKDGICVAYGATLALTVNGSLTLDDYYPEHDVTTGNGASYFPDARMLIENYGTMTIEGSGSIEMATYDLTGLTNIVDSDITYLIRNFNVMEISGVTVSSPYTQSALITNGWYDASQYGSDDHIGRGTSGTDDYATEATLTITSGNFTGGKYVVKNDYAGTLYIEDGTFTAVEDALGEGNYSGSDYQEATNAVICNLNIATISGGEFIGTCTTEGVIYNRVKNYDVDYEQGLLTIESGAFTASSTTDGICVYITGGAVTIEDGTFTGYYGAYLKDGDLDIEGGTFTDCVYPVYAVGGTLIVSADADIYLAAGASLDALTVTTGTVSITLLGGATIGSELYVADGAKVTLDMGTFRLTRSKASGDDGSVVENYGTMTIYGSGTSAQMAISSGTASDNMIRNHGTMYLVSVCLTTSMTGRALIANYSGAYLYIYGCTLIADYAYTNEEGGTVEYDVNTDFGDSLVVTDKGDGVVGIDVFTQASLAAAFAYDADEVDVTLESDITLSSTGNDWKLTVDEDAVIELDLAGYTLTSEEDSSNKEAILVQGTLTIKDTSDDGTGVISGTSRTINVGNEDKATSKNEPAEEASDAKLIIESGLIVAENSDTGDAYGIRNVGGTVEINGGTVSASASGSGDVYGVVMFDNGTIVMTGGSIIADGETTGEVYGISGNHDYAGTSGITLTISGDAEIYGRDCGIYNPQSGVTTISEYAKVSGGTGIEIKEGHLIVSDNVEISSDATEFSEKTNNNGYDISGAALAISDYEYEATGDYLTVTITGGTFSAGDGCYALYEKVEKESDGMEKNGHEIKMEISGGTFKGAVSSLNCTGFISGGDFTAVTTCICKYLAVETTVTCPLCDCDECTCDADCTCGCGDDDEP